MVFEDVHWIDPTSLEALSRIVDSVTDVRVLLIVSHRSEFNPHWIGNASTTAVHLNRLGEDETKAIIDQVSGNALLSSGVRQDIIERTDGIPFSSRR
jgi:predicted ATPase